LDGALFIHVQIQVKGRSDDFYHPVKDIARNQLQLQLLKSGRKSDVVFKVGGKSFSAHSQILCANAPLLSEISEICDQEGSSTVAINGIHPDVFRYVLKHTYAGVMPPLSFVLGCGKMLIDAANRYELVEMKMAVEHILVNECIIDNAENVSDYILFADAKSCPLLKEYAISFLTTYAQEVAI
jgi:hypothetical protein